MFKPFVIVAWVRVYLTAEAAERTQIIGDSFQPDPPKNTQQLI